MSSSDHFRPVLRNAFRCPLCCSTSYDDVFVRGRDDSLLQMQAYQCGGWLEIGGRICRPRIGEEALIPAGVRHTVRNVGNRVSRWYYGYKQA